MVDYGFIRLGGYSGGKSGSGVYQTIINEQPLHQTYIEPFLGYGGVIRRKRPGSCNIGIDLDPGVIALWNDAVVADDLGMQFIHADALEWLRKFRSNASDLIYLDPPYLESTLSGTQRYRHGFSVDAHVELLEILRELSCMVQLSGYASVLYDSMLVGWRKVEFQAMTRGGLRTECLWMNYSKPQQLHTTFYTGRNFRDRERIKRKRDRWLNRLARMDVLERNVIRDAIVQFEFSESDIGSVYMTMRDPLVENGDFGSCIIKNDDT